MLPNATDIYHQSVDYVLETIFKLPDIQTWHGVITVSTDNK